MQAKEEIEHALKIYKYLLDRGTSPTLESIGKPKASFEDLRSTFEAALKQEKQMESFLNSISVKAADAKDHVTLNFMAWFLEEQVEEVASVQTILDQIALAKDALFLVDQELGKRGE
jgi:ferritin